MRDIWFEEYGRFLGELNLNIGCAATKEPERNGHKWINLDFNPDVNPDVVADLHDLPLPFADNTFDCVLGSHVFEHIRRDKFLLLINDIHRILKPGGYMIGVTPYGTSNDAWENPFHLQSFTETTWIYPMWDAYKCDTAGDGATQGYIPKNWTMHRVTLIPYDEFLHDPELEFKRRHMINIIREVHVVLRAEK